MKELGKVEYKSTVMYSNYMSYYMSLKLGNFNLKYNDIGNCSTYLDTVIF